MEVPPPPPPPPQVAKPKAKAAAKSGSRKETHYSFRRLDDKSYQAIKMTPQGEPLDVYKLTPNGGQCSCPAHVYCRHQQMLKLFLGVDKVNTGWRYCFETETWFEPVKIDKPGGLYEGLFDDPDPDEGPPGIGHNYPPKHLVDL